MEGRPSFLIPAMPQITRTKLGAANFGPWENIVRVLILVWFMLYTLNAIPDIHPLVGRIAAKVNYWISYFFMFEYILRVLCAKPQDILKHEEIADPAIDRKSTRLNSRHEQ